MESKTKEIENEKIGTFIDGICFCISDYRMRQQKR